MPYRVHYKPLQKADGTKAERIVIDPRDKTAFFHPKAPPRVKKSGFLSRVAITFPPKGYEKGIVSFT